MRQTANLIPTIQIAKPVLSTLSPKHKTNQSTFTKKFYTPADGNRPKDGDISPIFTVVSLVLVSEDPRWGQIRLFPAASPASGGSGAQQRNPCLSWSQEIAGEILLQDFR